jgi:beta-hydroxyacyl-ACP dehydratase FabZ
MKLPLDYVDIIRVLPHRYPFLLVDRVVELEPGKRAVGIKNVTINEPFFRGHFPGNPIMPGVLIIEAMAQVGGVLARLSMPEIIEEEGRNSLLFVSIDGVKFRRPVIPGDQMVLKLKVLRAGTRIWKFSGEAFVQDDLVSEAMLVAAIGKRQQ